jgi:hypothetical protein
MRRNERNGPGISMVSAGGSKAGLPEALLCVVSVGFVEAGFAEETAIAQGHAPRLRRAVHTI